MCDLIEEPWRATFTGPNCRCGVPMPGTPEEQEIQDKMDAEIRAKRLEEHKIKLASKYGEKYGSLYIP